MPQQHSPHRLKNIGNFFFSLQKGMTEEAKCRRVRILSTHPPQSTNRRHTHTQLFSSPTKFHTFQLFIVSLVFEAKEIAICNISVYLQSDISPVHDKKTAE
jgi:hypothetical protein